jgi:cell division protein FtsN
MDKKVSPQAAAAIIAGAVLVLGVFGYMTFVRTTTQPQKLSASQQMQERIMKMSPEEKRRFGEAYAAKLKATNSGAP